MSGTGPFVGGNDGAFSHCGTITMRSSKSFPLLFSSRFRSAAQRSAWRAQTVIRRRKPWARRCFTTRTSPSNGRRPVRPVTCQRWASPITTSRRRRRLPRRRQQVFRRSQCAFGGLCRLQPRFPQGQATGGLAGRTVWDGRAGRLEDQAGGPPLNPIEMGMPDKKTVAARIQENSGYVDAIKRLYGKDALSTDDKAFASVTIAIAAFERTKDVSPFDSVMTGICAARGEVHRAGRTRPHLFFSTQFANCSLCHDIKGAMAAMKARPFRATNISTSAYPPMRPPAPGTA